MMVVAELYVPAIYLSPCRVIRNFNSTFVEAASTQRMTDAVKHTFYLLYRFVARLQQNCFYVLFSFACLIVNY